MAHHTDPDLLNNVLQLLTEQGHDAFAEGLRLNRSNPQPLRNRCRNNVARLNKRRLRIVFRNCVDEQ